MWRYLRAGMRENGQWSPSEKGAPQGGPLSPLLANIVLQDLDTELDDQPRTLSASVVGRR